MLKISANLTIGLILTALIISCNKSKIDNNNTSISKDTIISSFDTLKSGPVTLIVDPKYGARIISFQLDGNEMLTPRNINEGAFGSTFWLSPQSLWSWPPIAEIDTLPYQKENGAYKSQINNKFQFQIRKEFRANIDSSISIFYTVVNKSDTIQNIAPWEITRVPSGGVTFFETELNQTYTGLKPFGELNLVAENGFTKYTYDSLAVDDNKKSFAFAKTGWMAQLNKNLVFIKTFPNVSKSKSAPNESEIEIYANPNKKYIEIENQGEYRTLLPQDSMRYEVKWYLQYRQNINNNRNEYQRVANFIRPKLLP